jgi:cytochrome c2
MRRLALVGALLAVCELAPTNPPACASHESLSALLPGDPLQGSRLFAEKGCPTCHAIHGVGGTAGPDFGRGTLNRPLFEIGAIMWNHSPGMERLFQEKRIARPKFEPAEMTSLLAFLYYLGSLDPPGDAEAGGQLFRQKGCQTCHSVGGTGGSVGPKLDKYSRYASPLFLTSALWNHGKAMADTMERKGIPRPVFRGHDIPDLLAYVRSTAGTTERVYSAPGSPKHGEKLFTDKHCVECHSIRGHGGKVGPDLGIELSGSLMHIIGTMWNHGPKMWAKMAERRIHVPSLSPEEMSDLVSYLYFFQFIDAPGNAARGWTVYNEKRCLLCHTPDAAGQSVGPPIAQVVQELRTPIGLMTAMWNHAGNMTATMAEENVPWPILKKGEMADLIAYLLSGQSRGSERAESPGTRPTEK